MNTPTMPPLPQRPTPEALAKARDEARAFLKTLGGEAPKFALGLMDLCDSQSQQIEKLTAERANFLDTANLHISTAADRARAAQGRAFEIAAHACVDVGETEATPEARRFADKCVRAIRAEMKKVTQ